MYMRYYRSHQKGGHQKDGSKTSAVKNEVKKTKTKKKKLPKSLHKDTKYKNKVFDKFIKIYGEKRTTLYPWEKDMLIIWKEKAKASLEEKAKKDREEREKDEEEAKPDDIIQTISVKCVDFNIDDNAKAHRTDQYFATAATDKENKPKLRELVVRRGQAFKLTVKCDRPYKKADHDMQLVFKTGSCPNPTKETMARFDIDESGAKPEDTDNWHARLVELNENDIVVEILAPNDCSIGEWLFEIITTFVGKDDKVKQICYKSKDDITILLNPWCEDDACYMPETDLLDEYILASDGCVYTGSSSQQNPKEWHFGQFDPNILDVSLRLLGKALGFAPGPKMGDPIIISRGIAQIINMCGAGDDGVLIGNWSGNYEDGESPTFWSGSAKILNRYIKTKGPVKYGQCWVFSAITTTVCRALGLPCRSVTNFASAHDTDGSACIERMYEEDEFGNLDRTEGSDSIWNFHVWNEIWCDRPDLPPGYGGWQVIDATPQELSEGVYQCGPASVKAVKEGKCTLPYDTRFIFAEVNADILELQCVGNYSFDVMRRLTDRVGKKISTKKATGQPMEDVWFYKPDTNRDDLTDCYKHKEGSEEERAAVKEAKIGAKTDMLDYLAPQKDLEITLKGIEGVMIGDDCEIEVMIKNVCEEKRGRTMGTLKVKVYCCKYNGEPVSNEPIKTDEFIGIELDHNQEQSFKTTLRFDDYWCKMCEFGTMKVTLTGKCFETERNHVEFDDFRIRRPDLTAKGPSECKVGDVIDVEVSFKNPVPVDLPKCKLSVDTSLFQAVEYEDDDDIPIGEIKAKAEMKKTLKMKALKEAETAYITFNLDSPELHDICGSCKIKVKS